MNEDIFTNNLKKNLQIIKEAKEIRQNKKTSKQYFFVEVMPEANLNCFRVNTPHPRKGTYYLYCIKENNILRTAQAGVISPTIKCEPEIVPLEYIIRMDTTGPQK